MRTLVRSHQSPPESCTVHRYRRQRVATALALTLFLSFILHPNVSKGETDKTSFHFEDADGNEFNIQRLRSDRPSQLLAVWFVDHAERRPRFDSMLDNLAEAGIEVWRVDLLADLFLPRGNERVRTLAGEPVAHIIETALESYQGKVLLVSYDRMALPLLRGLRLWQAAGKPDARLLGAALFYPNLFGPSPAAGQAPDIDPIVAASNYPLVVFQPEFGSHRWRIPQIMEAFWDAGAAALFYRLFGIRDWFFMDEEGQEDPADAATLATVRKMPLLLKQAAKLLEGYAPPAQAKPLLTTANAIPIQTAPTPIDPPRPAPLLDLPRYPAATRSEAIDFKGKVTVVVFWASWCPPCVKEMPSLNQLQQRFNGKPFQIVSVDFQEPPEVIERFLQKVPVEFPILLDQNGSTSAQWQVFSFPSAFIVDAEGDIRFSLNHAIDWNTAAIHHLVEQLLP